jgi:hypothetical protein
MGTGDVDLYYYRARYYDPYSSRFFSEDPIGFNGALNFYAYVDNDPGDYDDPFGLRKYKCPLFGPCVKLPSGNHRPRPIPDTAGSSLVDQQLQAYRNCVSAGIKGIQDPPPRPPDPTLGIPGGLGDMKPNAQPMPGDPSGPFAFPDPHPSPLSSPDGLAEVDALTRMYNCNKRGKVADDCSDRFPLAKLSRQF